MGRPDRATFLVVGGHETGMFLPVNRRVEHHDRDSRVDGLRDHLALRFLVERGEGDTVHAQVDHVLDNLVLFGDLRLGDGAFPLQFSAQGSRGFLRAFLHGFPELTPGALGDHRQGQWLRGLGRGRRFRRRR